MKKEYISDIWTTYNKPKKWFFQKQYDVYALYDSNGQHVRDFKKFRKLTKYIKKHS